MVHGEGESERGCVYWNYKGKRMAGQNEGGSPKDRGWLGGLLFLCFFPFQLGDNAKQVELLAMRDLIARFSHSSSFFLMFV